MHACTWGGVYKYLGMPRAFSQGGDGWGVYVHVMSVRTPVYAYYIYMLFCAVINLLFTIAIIGIFLNI